MTPVPGREEKIYGNGNGECDEMPKKCPGSGSVWKVFKVKLTQVGK